MEAAYLLGVGLWWAGSWGMGAGGRVGVGVAVGWRVACRTASSKSSIHLLLAETEKLGWKRDCSPVPSYC